MKSLIVEGWRFLPHSYAVVNQWQLLSLSRLKNLSLRIRDMPLYHQRWERQAGLFDEADEEVLRSLELAAAGERADATFRITFPYDFAPSGANWPYSAPRKTRRCRGRSSPMRQFIGSYSGEGLRQTLP